MMTHYPVLRNMTHALSLSVFIVFKGSDLYIFIQKMKTADSILLSLFMRNNDRCDIPHAA